MQIHSMVARSAVAVTPSNSTANLNLVGLYVGGTGDVKVDTPDDQGVVFNACPVGLIIPMIITKVWSTGTTATLLTGFKG